MRDVWEDPSISAYPVAVLDRMTRRRLDQVVESMSLEALGSVFDELGRLAAGWQAVFSDDKTSFEAGIKQFM